MRKTIYVFDRNPRDFEEQLDEYRSEGYRIVRFMVRPRTDGSAFCFAKLRLTMIGSMRQLLRSTG